MENPQKILQNPEENKKISQNSIEVYKFRLLPDDTAASEFQFANCVCHCSQKEEKIIKTKNKINRKLQWYKTLVIPPYTWRTYARAKPFNL